MKRINGVTFNNDYLIEMEPMQERPEDFRDFSYYQNSAKKLAVYPNAKHSSIVKYESNAMDPEFSYLGFKLAGETGELLEKLGKLIREANGTITPENKIHLLFELGDVLWYVSELARQLGWNLSEVAAANLAKLNDRVARNKLLGNGDER